VSRLANRRLSIIHVYCHIWHNRGIGLAPSRPLSGSHTNIPNHDLKLFPFGRFKIVQRSGSKFDKTFGGIAAVVNLSNIIKISRILKTTRFIHIRQNAKSHSRHQAVHRASSTKGRQGYAYSDVIKSAREGTTRSGEDIEGENRMETNEDEKIKKG